MVHYAILYIELAPSLEAFQTFMATSSSSPIAAMPIVIADTNDVARLP